MKFTKTVAQALANKVRRNLASVRAEKINNFNPSQQTKEEIVDSIHKYLAAREAYFEAGKIMRRGLKSFNIYDTDSVEDILRKILHAMAELAAPKIPTYDDLVDDFLIESLDTENSEELIEKVTAKYIA